MHGDYRIKDMHLKMSQCLYKIDGATPKFSNPESKPVTSRS